MWRSGHGRREGARSDRAPQVVRGHGLGDGEMRVWVHVQAFVARGAPADGTQLAAVPARDLRDPGAPTAHAGPCHAPRAMRRTPSALQLWQ